MSEHSSIERHCDVAVVGGSAAGLAAALQLGRQRRRVLVIDSGEPRNAPAAHMHGFLGRDGQPPSDLVAAGRAEVRSYGGELLSGRVDRVERLDDDRFRLALSGGTSVVARRVLAATGLVDELPDIAGVAEHWGRDVIHCPFCHGYEVRDRRIVQIITHPMGLHPVGLFRQLTDHLTVVVHEDEGIEGSALERLRADGVEVVHEKVRSLVTGADDRLEAVELVDGRRIGCDVVAVGPRFRVRTEPFRELGLVTAVHPSGLGDFVETDATGATHLPGLYAAGNVTDPSHQVLQAAADGARVGAMISFDLAAQDLDRGVRPSASESDWDRRYSDEPVWSGNPNGTLVAEVGELTAGRALDVGAGEGGDAIWLAERGWAVTASDISRRALDRVAAEAGRRGLGIDRHHVDANALDAFEAEAFDLVSAQYASVPRTPEGRAIHNIIDAVAPGGTLVVVGHDPEAMRTQLDDPDHPPAFDPDAYIRTTDFVAVLDRSSQWKVEVHEKRLRPPGAASASHHVEDIVLRARRVDG